MTDTGQAFGFPTLEQLRDWDSSSTPQNNDIIVFDSTTGKWYASASLPATAGVDSLQVGSTGTPIRSAIVLNSPNATLNLTNASQTFSFDINVANANTWAAVQTFGNNISFGGATLNVSSLATGHLLQYNGSNWVNVAPSSFAVTGITAGTGITVTGTTGAVTVANAGVTSAVAGDGVSVSAATGAITFAAVLNGTTLSLGTAGLSLNLANANTWTAVQTFSAGITGTGTTGSLTAGSGILATANSWSATQTLTNAVFSGQIYPSALSNSGGVTWTFGSACWGGAAPGTSTSTTGIVTTGGSGSQLFTFSSNVAQCSLNIDGSYFAGDIFDFNPFGTDVASVGDILAGGNIAVGGLMAARGLATFDSGITGTGTTGALTAGSGILGTANSWAAVQTFQPSTSVTAMAILGEQSTSATAMVNIIYTTTDGNGVLGAGAYPFIQATAGTDLFIGVQAGNSNTGTASQFSQNTGVGYQAVYSNTTGIYNSAFGWQTLYSNTTGYSNAACGYSALFSNTSGIFNTAFGYSANYSTATGNGNTACGYAALYANTGSYNTALGCQALYNSTTATDGFLIAVGYQAGNNYTQGIEINNIVIGYNLGVAGESSMLRIGQPSASTPTGQIAFSMLGLSGLGLSPIYGTGLIVSLGTTSTTVATYTPTSSTGSQFTIKWSLSCVTASTPTLTLTFTDPKAGAQTITLFNSAMTANSVAQGTYNLTATSAAAVLVAGLDSIAAGDVFASATIEQSQ